MLVFESICALDLALEVLNVAFVNCFRVVLELQIKYEESKSPVKHAFSLC